MAVGSGDTVSGKVQLYSSADLLSWSYVGVLHEGDGSTGTMWECPNFFPLDGKWVLFYGGGGLEWYEAGSYNGSVFTSEKTGLLDAGPDSYAAQWYKDDTGRDLAITWMGNWGTSKWPSKVNGWAGAQSVIRELFIHSDGGLGSKPIQEIASLASAAAIDLCQTDVHGITTVGSSNTARLELVANLGSTDAPSFTIKIFPSSTESMLFTYSIANQTLTLDTTNAGYGQAGTWEATIATSANGTLTMDILIDRSVVEIFTGDRTVMTAAVYPRYEESNAIEIVAHGGKAAFDSIMLHLSGPRGPDRFSLGHKKVRCFLLDDVRAVRPNNTETL
jgi:beta-fructofuranosidase